MMKHLKRVLIMNYLHTLSLFFEGDMRKTKTSVFYDYIKPMENTNVELNFQTYVVDGGSLTSSNLANQIETI